jgi:hypothetical protein
MGLMEKVDKIVDIGETVLNLHYSRLVKNTPLNKC